MTSGSSPAALPRGARPRITYSPTTQPAPRSTFGPTIAVLWTSSPMLVTPGSRSDRLLERDSRARRLQRPVSRLEHAHDPHSGLAIAPRRLAVADALDEVPDLELQRFGHRHPRAVDVAGAVAPAKLVRGQLGDAMVVDLHLLRRMPVVVDGHPLVPDDGHRPELARREPRKVRMGDRARGEAHGEEDDVLDVRLHVAAAHALHPLRLLLEPVEDDRRVVGAEVPEDVEVELMEAEIDPLAIDVLDLSELAAIDDPLHGRDRGVVDERVPDHEHAPGPAGGRDDGFGVGDGPRERLLDEHVLAGGEGLLREGAVRRDRRHHADRVDGGIRQQLAVVRRRADRREPFVEGAEPLGVEVGDGHDVGAGCLAEVADEIRSPVARADHAHPQRAGHAKTRSSYGTLPMASCFVRPDARKSAMASPISEAMSMSTYLYRPCRPPVTNPGKRMSSVMRVSTARS